MEKLLNNRTIRRKEIMPEKKTRQLEIEVNTWKRFLDFYREENVHLKNRFSEILKDRFDKMLLEEMENFQTKFIKQDEVISLLRNDAAELDKLLLKEKSGVIIGDSRIDKKLDCLRNNMANFGRQFFQLQLNFNTYILENM